MSKIVCGAAVAAIGLLFAVDASAQVLQEATLSSIAARKIGEACIDFAAKNDMREAVTVMNRHGDVLYYYRMDGTADIAAETSTIKAKTGVYTGRTGDDMAPINPNLLAIKGLFASHGGSLPIKIDGVLIGAVGAGGSAGEKDQACAQAGVDAVFKK